MPKTYCNPVASWGNDPWVIRRGGAYYYCYSGRDRTIFVAKLDSLTQLGQTQGVPVYQPPENRAYSQELWAPELHYLDGRWYIYVAADDGDNVRHRMFCLEGDETDPQKPFVLKSKLADDGDHWAIDGTVLQLDGRLYFIWSGWEGYENLAQDIYIAPMSTPYTLCGPRVRLSRPEYEWELRGGDPKINEGPAVLRRDGKTFLAYSASGSWSDDYCLGLLTFLGGNPLDPSRWQKSEKPFFAKSDQVFGPGHCSFTTSPDGREDWMIFHANPVSGSGWAGRTACIQRVDWREGVPFLGQPLPFGQAAPVPSGE